jgi:hypothetical protein
LVRAWNTIFRKIYRIIRVLSLDILAGVYCGYTFARLILESDCPPVTPAILCLSVWLIYTMDHLLDARSLKENAHKQAYRWHWENRKIIWPVWLSAGLATIGLSLVFLPARILIFGAITVSLVIMYTLVHQGMIGSCKRYLFKEGWISILYTAGVWGVPLLYHGAVPGIPVILAIIIYLLLVLINVLIYSYHDYHRDCQESQQTLATVAGRKTASHVLRLLILSVFTLILVGFFISDDTPSGYIYIILICMAAILGLILAFPRVFSQHERYGILADGVFLLPGLLVWLW